MTFRYLALLVLTIFVGTGCSKSTPAKVGKPTVVKIAVQRDGTIFLDGNKATLDEVKKRLDSLDKENAQVWYYREHPGEHPPKEAVQVVTEIAKHELPISFSTQPDFSDTVDAKGKTKPRSNK